MAVKLFFCYAHEDEALLNKLKTHLSPLQREGFIDVWYDRDIGAGTEWESEIDKHLNTAQIILLLVSPDFMASEYCYSIEMRRALERHERGEVCVIPIILRPVYWQGTLGKLQALPTDAKPVTDPDWHNLDRAFFNVTEEIRKSVIEVEKKNAKPTIGGTAAQRAKSMQPKEITATSPTQQQAESYNLETRHRMQHMDPNAESQVDAVRDKRPSTNIKLGSRHTYFILGMIALILLIIILAIIIRHPF